MSRERGRSRSFALIVTLLLVTMLAVVGAGLAMTVSAEAVQSHRVLMDFHHELAVDSFLAVFADVWRRGPAEQPERPRRLDIAFGDWRVVAEVRREAGKRLMTAGDPDSTRNSLRDLAADNGLFVASVHPRPIHEAHRKQLGDYVWFDQLIAASEFEEVFRWGFVPVESSTAYERKAWSDLITFWRGEHTLAVELETRLLADVRRWYLVVDVVGDRVRVLHRSRI